MVVPGTEKLRHRTLFPSLYHGAKLSITHSLIMTLRVGSIDGLLYDQEAGDPPFRTTINRDRLCYLTFASEEQAVSPELIKCCCGHQRTTWPYLAVNSPHTGVEQGPIDRPHDLLTSTV